MTLLGGPDGGKAAPAQPQGPVYALLLASGRGSRFGDSKLHALYRGRPLLAHSLSLIRAACDRGLLGGARAVIHSLDQRAARMAREAGVQAVLNDAPDTGLSGSLRRGLEDLRREGRAAAALIFLGDQPLVRLDVVEALANAWHNDRRPIIRPRYAARPDVPGHPVLLSRAVWSRVRDLRGDVGFSALRDPGADDALLLDVSGDNPDIDTPADLQRLERAFRDSWPSPTR